jgi:glutamine amidotransferase
MKPKDITISRETLLQCFNSNSDGAGFMYHNRNKKLQVRKGYFTFDDFWKAYEPMQNKAMAIHFRIKTHGDIDKHNCHPFLVNDKLGFIHNGTIKGYSSGHQKSDTWQFNEDILQPFVDKWGKLALFDDPMRKLVEDYIGWSKLVFMDNEGNFQIFNEDKGVWDNGVWYSNSSYKPYVPPPMSIPPKVSRPVSNTTGHPWNDYYSTPYPSSTSKAPYKKKELIKEGTLVYFINNYYDVDTKEIGEQDSVWEVIAYNANYTVDLMEDTDDTLSVRFLYNVPLWNIDLLDDDDIFPGSVITKEYNHGI